MGLPRQLGTARNRWCLCGSPPMRQCDCYNMLHSLAKRHRHFRGCSGRCIASMYPPHRLHYPLAVLCPRRTAGAAQETRSHRGADLAAALQDGACRASSTLISSGDQRSCPQPLAPIPPAGAATCCWAGSLQQPCPAIASGSSNSFGPDPVKPRPPPPRQPPSWRRQPPWRSLAPTPPSPRPPSPRP